MLIDGMIKDNGPFRFDSSRLGYDRCTYSSVIGRVFENGTHCKELSIQNPNAKPYLSI